MGEPLPGVRDARGRVGIIDQHCPRRGTNLWLGRNEGCGNPLRLSRLEVRCRRPLPRHAAPTPGIPSARSRTPSGPSIRANGVIAAVDENHVPLRHKGNDNQIDRQLQKSKSYTGIQAVSEQEAAVQDSQGPIADRTRQHLGILRFRKLMMDCTRDLANGKELDAVRCAERYLVRAGLASGTRAKASPP